MGKAKNLAKRVAQYRYQKNFLSPKLDALLSRISSVHHIVVGSEIEAFLLEANLIKKYHPFYNIKLVDDKAYPYIQISSAKKLKRMTIPYISIVRRKDEKRALYFGPYPEGSSVKTVLSILRKIFPFQSVKNHPDTKCLYYHMGLCPCISVFPEHLATYKRTIKKIEQFLKGEKRRVISELERERDIYSKREEFEKAQRVQDQIDKVNLVTSPHYHPFSYERNPLAYREKIDNELSSLRQILVAYFHDISKLERIECYDISNISGTNATGSMVVFTNGEANKAFYRRFKIRSKQTPDDTSMMQEVIERRLNRTEWEYPNLIIVDGGKGQVAAAYKVLVRHHLKQIPLIGIAKREEVIVGIKKTLPLEFFEARLPLTTPGVNMIRKIRDEAHRFAITYHRLLRKKALKLN